MADRDALNDLLCRFFRSFDEKDWKAMRSCLADTVWTDYSSFRDVEPEEISGDRYVAQREAALSALDMQHNFLNLRAEIDDASARGWCNYIIHRFHPDFDGRNDAFFHSYGCYEFGFLQVDDEWRISAIRQILLRNHGNLEIHGATRSVENTRDV
ncbi:MAG: nuclear transport factor 2 family protein [Alphaproteobacteria bacterium]